LAALASSFGGLFTVIAEIAAAAALTTLLALVPGLLGVALLGLPRAAIVSAIAALIVVLMTLLTSVHMLVAASSLTGHCLILL
jgi:hypothetical protein